MDMNFSAEDLAFRVEVRDYLDSAMPDHLKAKATQGGGFSHDDEMEWHKILAAKGWAAPRWPVEHGGTAWSVTQSFIFSEECTRANTPTLSPFGLGMVGPLMIQYGTPEQKERFLPKILAGEEVWCQGYSEPNAGSDLASLQLRADDAGDHYILNGQKTWTSAAQYADWIFVLARTSGEGKKQEGITFLLADIKNTDGIDVKPFYTIGGTPAFSDTFFQNAKVPKANRVGPEGGGWTMAKALLGHERTGIGGVGNAKRFIELAKQIARDTPNGTDSLLDDATFRRRIAKLEMRIRTIEMANLRTLASASHGQAPGPESSILKIVGTEATQEATELAMDALGQGAQGWFDAPEGTIHESSRQLQSTFNYLRAATIYGGSNEIQKNIISKHILGLGALG